MSISVIVPAYNEEKYIGSCLSSLFNQTFPIDYEVLVVNDKSNDNTEQIVKIMQEENENLHLLNKSSQEGVSMARNFGAQNSENDIVAFLDADCVANDKWLINTYDAIKRGSSSAIGPVVLKSYSSITQRAYFQPSHIVGQIFNKTNLPICAAGNNCAFSKDFFESIGGYRNVFVEDFDIVLRGRKMGKMCYEKGMQVFTSPRRIQEQGYLKTSLRLASGYVRLLANKPRKSLEDPYFKAHPR